MIKYFTVENFQSIQDEVILEFDSNINQDSPFSAHPIIGFAGANASGKTTILKALTFVIWFLQVSFLELKEGNAIPVESFWQHQKNIKFHLIFSTESFLENDSGLLDYEYQLEILDGEVLNESLGYFPSPENEESQNIYSRGEEEISFGPLIAESTFRILEETEFRDLRDNCSLVSYLAQFKSQKVAQICQQYNCYSNVASIGRQEIELDDDIIIEIVEDEKLKAEVKYFLNVADVGISDLGFVEERDATDDEVKNTVANILFEQQTGSDQKSFEEIYKEVEANYPTFKAGHQQNKDKLDVQPKAFSFRLQHQVKDNQSVYTHLDLESSGTRNFLALIYQVIKVFEHGGILIIDEIAANLHQDLVAYIIGLFSNRYNNPKGAQLFFSFHNTSLMEILMPEQLWFAEKNDEGVTDIFSASDFKDIKEIKQRSLEELYRLGRFGAKPRGI